MHKNSLDKIIKIGAISSVIGSGLLVILALTIILFPLQKICYQDQKCDFISSAPFLLRQFVNPRILVIALLLIAGGVLMLRFGSWYKYKK